VLNDITNVNIRNSEICENIVEFIFINIILVLARNIRVVTQIESRINVLDVESNIDVVVVGLI
jgi:hypothetical protein